VQGWTVRQVIIFNPIGVCNVELFTAVIITAALKGGVYVTASHCHPSLIFETRLGA